MNSPKLCQKTGGALKKNPSRHLSEATTSQSVNKAAAHKAEEDSRRRTIILEKKEGSFGFTIQSYGIHFKKEREVEMISYVDSVEFNGAAARAGLREGDVILSINGIDVDKADHDTLVNFIQNCDTRMRMVVLFEDCVRKVDLQRQAIEIKREINERVEELTQLCLLEHEITKGNMKTHSLPSQKKQSQKSADIVVLDSDDYEICSRSGMAKKKSSSERKNSKSNQYFDGKTIIFKNSAPNFDQNRDKYVFKAPAMAISKGKVDPKPKKAPRPQSRCYPCYQPQNESNIEAYDLASPCCKPHYFRFYHHKKSTKDPDQKKERKPSQREKKDGFSQTKRHFDETFEVPSRSGSYRRYMAIDLDNMECKVQSCTSSEKSVHNCEASYTSYSTDTLFLDDNPKGKNLDQQKKSSSAHFTTKTFGGYGFGGYGFGSKNHNHNQRGQMKSSKSTNTEHHSHGYSSDKHRSHNGQKNKNPTKSTENLLVNAEYQDLNVSNPSVSYDCLSMINSETSSRQNDRIQMRGQERVEMNHPEPRHITHYTSHLSRPHVVLKSFRKRRSNSAEIMRQ